MLQVFSFFFYPFLIISVKYNIIWIEKSWLNGLNERESSTQSSSNIWRWVMENFLSWPSNGFKTKCWKNVVVIQRYRIGESAYRYRYSWELRRKEGRIEKYGQLGNPATSAAYISIAKPYPRWRWSSLICHIRRHTISSSSSSQNQNLLQLWQKSATSVTVTVTVSVSISVSISISLCSSTLLRHREVPCSIFHYSQVSPLSVSPK